MGTGLKTRLAYALLAGAAAVALSATEAFAQTAAGGAPPAGASAAQEGEQLQQIVVTARKRAENLQTLPLAVTALNSKMLQQAQVTSLNDLGQMVPSLITTEEGEFGNTTTVALRGFVDENPTNLLGDSPVAVYLDGVYIGRDAGNTFNLVDMDRVEVEAGPQGTLYGRNATGGAVSLYTQPPAKTFGAQEKLSYGTFNDFISRTTIDTGELGNTGFYAKLAYMYHSRDGVVRNTLAPSRADDPGAINSNSFFFALHGNLGPKVTLDYIFDWDQEWDVDYAQQTAAGSPAFVQLYSNTLGGAPYPILGTPGPNGTILVQPKYEFTITQAYLGHSPQFTGGHNLTLNWEVNNDIQLKSITAYRSFSLKSADNFGGGPDDTGYLLNPVTHAVTVGPIPVFDILKDYNGQHQISEELQLNGKWDRLTYVAGLYYFDERVGQNFQGGQLTYPLGFIAPGVAAGIVSGASTHTLYDGESTSRAAYFNAAYKPPILDDKLEISVGARYTWDTKSIHQTMAGEPVDVRDTRNFFNTSVSGSIKYQWTPDIMTYFRAGDAYRAGGFNPQNTQAQGANSFAPEEVTSYELGVKSDWADHHVRLNADVYYTDYTNEQIPVTGTAVGGFSTFTANAGHATFLGFEGQATVIPARGWQMDGTIGLISPRYLEYQAVQNGPNVGSEAKFPYLATTTASADLIYTFSHMAIGDLTARIDWSYELKIDFGTIPSPYRDAMAAPPINRLGAELTLANIPLNWRNSTFEVELYGKNLLDIHNPVLAVDLIQSLGFVQEQYGIGRELGVMFEGKF